MWEYHDEPESRNPKHSYEGRPVAEAAVPVGTPCLSIRQSRPDLRQSRTYKTVKARFWPWLAPIPGETIDNIVFLPPRSAAVGFGEMQKDVWNGVASPRLASLSNPCVLRRGVGFRVEGLRFGISGFGFWGFEFRVEDLGFRVSGFGLRV